MKQGQKAFLGKYMMIQSISKKDNVLSDFLANWVYFVTKNFK